MKSEVIHPLSTEITKMAANSKSIIRISSGMSGDFFLDGLGGGVAEATVAVGTMGVSAAGGVCGDATVVGVPQILQKFALSFSKEPQLLQCNIPP